MKKLLLILLCLPMIGFGQLTYVPDDNFEASLEANGMGNGIANDDFVTTANINMVQNLHIYNQNIYNLTGIEDFTSLRGLYCYNNQLTTLDLSQNSMLENLNCNNNQLSTLDVSQNNGLASLHCDNNQLTSLTLNNHNLTILYCNYNQLTSLDLINTTYLNECNCWANQLTSLDVSGCTNLKDLNCDTNQLTTLDVSQNTALQTLWCHSNQLTSLDVRNWNNTNMDLEADANPNLTCINVDDVAWATYHWTVANGNIDAQHFFSNNCSAIGIEEHNTNKELLKITDLLDKETKQTNQLLFYIYDDGTVEKRIVIE